MCPDEASGVKSDPEHRGVLSQHLQEGHARRRHRGRGEVFDGQGLGLDGHGLQPEKDKCSLWEMSKLFCTG